MAELSIAKQCDIILKAEEVWADSQNQVEMYSAEVETVKAMATQQAGRTEILTQIENPALEDDEIEVVWLDFCETPEPGDCSDVCDFDGAEPVLDSKKYKMDLCKELTFSLDENSLLRNRYTFEEVAAKGLLAKMKAFDEYLNRQALLFLSANAGFNKGQSGTFTGNTMVVPASEYTEELMVDMVIDAKLNKLSSPFLVDSGALYKAFLNANYNQGNLDGKGAAVKANLFPAYFDMVGFASAPVPDTSFLITPYSYAIANRAYNPVAPAEVSAAGGVHQIRYQMASKNIPGIVYDIYHQKECSGRRFKHSWLVQLNWKFLLNPAGCEIGEAGDQVTGILSYTKEGSTT